MAGTQYESVICVKNEVFVYKIPARTTNRGYRAADWTLDKPDWVGRLKVVALSESLTIRLEDKNSGELFAKCPVDQYPGGTSVEQVLDSSRYFVIRIKDDSGRSAFIGIGFSDRGDSFDLLVAMQDHFKWLKRETDIETDEKKQAELLTSGPKLDLGFKEGQTIKISLNTKRQGDDEAEVPASSPGAGKRRGRAQGGAGGGLGILPPPPGGAKLTPPPRAPTAVAATNAAPLDLFGGSSSQPQSRTGASGANNLDLLMNLGSAPVGGTTGTGFQLPEQPAAMATNSQGNNDPWGDFTSASGSTPSASNQSSSSSSTDWVSFE